VSALGRPEREQAPKRDSAQGSSVSAQADNCTSDTDSRS